MITFNNFNDLNQWASESNNRFSFLVACEPCILTIEELESYFTNKEFAKISINEFLSTAPEGTEIFDKSNIFPRFAIAAPVSFEEIKQYIESCE